MTPWMFLLCTIAVVCLYVWTTYIATNRKRIAVASVEAARTAADTSLVGTAMVVNLFNACLAMVLLVGAVFFTMSPFLDHRFGPALSFNHVLGMILDWSAFMMVAAVVESFEEVTAHLRMTLKPGTKEPAEVEQEEDIPEGPSVLPGAGGASRQPRTPPDTIQCEIPDHWLSQN